MPKHFLQRNERITVSTVVRAEPRAVYDVVSDVTRIPDWSPECHRCEWIAADRFKGWNRKGLGRWSTTSIVGEDVPGEVFSFAPQVQGRDFTRWTYRMEPAREPGTTLLSEEFELCVKLHPLAIAFELVVLFVPDRRADLRANMERSIDGVKRIVESEAVGD